MLHSKAYQFIERILPLAVGEPIYTTTHGANER